MTIDESLMPPRLKSPVPLTHFLKEWRKSKQLTLQQVADRVGTTKGQLSQIENGKSGLTPSMAEAIAVVLQIDAETLRRRKPGEGMDLEQELLTLFRGADAAQRRVILDMARSVRSMDRREVHGTDQPLSSLASAVDPD